MSSASRRTWQTHRVGYLHLTVEAEPLVATLTKQSSWQKRGEIGGLPTVTKQLVELLDTHRLPATWAVGDPAHSATTALVTLSPVQHELALLGDQHWLGPTAGRTRFARELARRVAQARAQGIDLVTIVPRVATVAEHIDLVVKQGIRAVMATSNASSGRNRAPTTRALHYGVWEFSPSERLPLESSWLLAGWKLYRSIRRAAVEISSFHLVIDAAAVEQQGRWVMGSIARLARRVALLRDRGLLRVETLGAAAARLSDLPAATPQRSILRVAA
jgi:hypothetical protein